MDADDKRSKRRYAAERRQAAAAERRLRVVAAARQVFEERGWAGARVREIGVAAGVSQKLVEAVYGTKAELLRAAVELAIRGDLEPTPMPRRQRVREMEAAPDAATMLRLHATHLRLVNAGSSRIAFVVEQGAAADPVVAELWREMDRNRVYAVSWATDTLLAKPGLRGGLRREAVVTAFWVALDWGTYRLLTGQAGLDDDGYEAWLRDYYAALLLPPPS